MTPLDPSEVLAASGDGLLADRAAGGDLRSFTVLVQRHGPKLRAYAVRITGNDADGDDVVQEAFIVAWDQLAQLEDKAAFRGWLFRIASRKAIDHLRARRDTTQVQEDDAVTAADTTGGAVEHTLQQEALTAALTRLPQLQQRCWMLREVGGLSYDEIAEELSVPASTVRGALSRARKQLIQEMGEWR